MEVCLTQCNKRFAHHLFAALTDVQPLAAVTGSCRGVKGNISGTHAAQEQADATDVCFRLAPEAASYSHGENFQ